MSDWIVDSSVVAKWVLPEPDSPKAHALLSQTAVSNGELVIVDLAFPEVANAIWKRHRKIITLTEAEAFLTALTQLPVRVEPAVQVLEKAFDIAVRYDRSVYDALFVALVRERGSRGVTADEPLVNALKPDFPDVVLLRDL